MADQKHAAGYKPFDASEWHVGIVVGDFNSAITKKMLDETNKALGLYKVKKENITVVHVAGAADMPAALESVARNDMNRCIITLGAIIRGETAHFDYVAKIAADAVREVAIKHAKPIAFGILTCDTQEQAKDRISHSASYVDAALHAAKSLST